MIQLVNEKQLKQVENLSFCYWCGREFGPGDHTNRDHVPPKALFDTNDRSSPLILKTHIECNENHKHTDELMGQLVALDRGYVTLNQRNKRLKIERYPDQEFGAVANIKLTEAIWRYILAFHVALYRKPLSFGRRTITTPFTRGYVDNDKLILEDIKKDQYLKVVQAIKDQRSVGNVDRISSNNNQLKYECVWVRAEDQTMTLSNQKPNRSHLACFFALEIYDWKQLGYVGLAPARGCAGAYFSSDGQAPGSASLFRESAPPAINNEPWDPFGQ